MKFSRREDIEAPLATVFQSITDFPALQRMAMRRGFDASRQDQMDTPGAGMRWLIRGPVRGRMREIEVEMTQYVPASGLVAVAASGGIQGTVTVDLVELSKARTRMQVGLDLRASTLPARLLLQSARLGKASLDRRFARRIAELAGQIEARHGKPGKGRGAAGIA